MWCATAGAIGFALLIVGGYQRGRRRGAGDGRRGGGRGRDRAPARRRASGPTTARRPRRSRSSSPSSPSRAPSIPSICSATAIPASTSPTGRSIARTHELRPKTHFGPFAAPAFGDPNARYDPDFFPMLPVLLALGWSLGGDTRAAARRARCSVRSGCSRCYALASRVLGTRIALLVAGALRGRAAAALVRARRLLRAASCRSWCSAVCGCSSRRGLARRWEVAVVSGALVASSALARIDCTCRSSSGALVLVAARVGPRATRNAEPGAVAASRRRVRAGASSVGPWSRSRRRSSSRTGTSRRSGAEYRELVAAFTAAILGAGRRGVRPPGPARASVVGSPRRAISVRRRRGRRAPPCSSGPTSGGRIPRAIFRVVAPGKPTRPAAARGERLALQPVVALVLRVLRRGRDLSSRSPASSCSRARARRGDNAAAAVFLVVVPVAVLYIARPSIQPDQPWAMRRYLPVVIPGVAIAVVVAFDAAWRVARSATSRSMRRRGERSRRRGRGARRGADRRGRGPVRRRARCNTARRRRCTASAASPVDDGAVLVYGGHFLDIELPQAIRVFCGVPIGHREPESISRNSPATWHALGRRLLVATAGARRGATARAGRDVVGHFVISDDDDPERVFDTAPRRFRRRVPSRSGCSRSRRDRPASQPRPGAGVPVACASSVAYRATGRGARDRVVGDRHRVRDRGVVRRARGGRMAAEPPPPVFDPEEAYEWVVEHVPDVVAATLTPDDVRRILDFQLEYFQRKGVTGQRFVGAPAGRRRGRRRGDRRLHPRAGPDDRRGVPARAGARRHRDPARLPPGDRRGRTAGRAAAGAARSLREPVRRDRTASMFDV